MKPFKSASMGMALLTLASYSAAADPTPGAPTVLGPFTGVQATLHPSNVSPRLIQYYGTDLGFSYQHNGKIQLLFGDSLANDAGDPIQASTGGTYDDGFGSIDLSVYSNPSLFTPTNRPLIKLGQNPGTTEMSAINPGHAMDVFKTPLGGFSNGSREFGAFYTAKAQGCLTDADCHNQHSDLTCDTGLGFFGEQYITETGTTGGCVDGDFGCLDDTMADFFGFPIPGTGFCRDKTSTIWASTNAGRIMGIGLMQRIGIRSTTDARSYTSIQQWLTNKFLNVAIGTAQDFVPANGSGSLHQNYNVATGSGSHQRVFLWGRPGFIGVNARGRTLGLYFAYVDMPTGSGFGWTINYYTSTVSGIPRFSPNERDAAPLDLDVSAVGIQPTEPYDVVDETSVVWVNQLKKWVMFYGGGITNLPMDLLPECGVVEYFTGSECHDVVIGNGAIRMRTADDPWGPWTRPYDVIVGGDPNASPLAGQYAPGGVLRHPSCSGPTCAPHTSSSQPNEHGFFYGANIISSWITTAGTGVDIFWNASTWDPYRIVLLKTHINPG